MFKDTVKLYLMMH